jgi:DNA-binding NarL/FixJ family response regulator
MMAIRILIVDDHAVVRDGLRGRVPLPPDADPHASARHG